MVSVTMLLMSLLDEIQVSLTDLLQGVTGSM